MEEPKFKLSRVSGQPVKDSELVDDLKRVVNTLETNTLPQRIYGDLGQYDISTVIRRFVYSGDSLLQTRNRCNWGVIGVRVKLSVEFTQE